MSEPLEISRRVRKEIRGRTVRASIAADLSIAATSGPTATVRQQSVISQGGSKVAPATDDQEQP